MNGTRMGVAMPNGAQRTPDDDQIVSADFQVSLRIKLNLSAIVARIRRVRRWLGVRLTTKRSLQSLPIMFGIWALFETYFPDGLSALGGYAEFVVVPVSSLLAWAAQKLDLHRTPTLIGLLSKLFAAEGTQRGILLGLAGFLLVIEVAHHLRKRRSGQAADHRVGQ